MLGNAPMKGVWSSNDALGNGARREGTLNARARNGAWRAGDAPLTSRLVPKLGRGLAAACVLLGVARSAPAQPGPTQPGPTQPGPTPPEADATTATAEQAREQAAASASPDLDERAQRHWGSGMAYLDEDEYSKALEAFQKAYELSGRPRILLAIAVTHERRGDLPAAVAVLDEYLRLSPGADNVASIAAHRDELQQQHDEQLLRMREAQAKEAREQPLTKRADGQSPASTDDPTRPATPPASRSSMLQWTALGVGVASGVAATVSGLLARQEYAELERGECGTRRACSRQDTQPGRTMAWVSTALSGVAVVGLGVGLWLVWDEDEDSPRDRGTKTPPGRAHAMKVNVACEPSGLSSTVTWSF